MILQAAKFLFLSVTLMVSFPLLAVQCSGTGGAPSPTPTPSGTPTPTPSPTPTPTPSPTPTPTPTPSPTPTPTPSPTPTPTATPSAYASIIPGFNAYAPSANTNTIPLTLSTTPPLNTLLVVSVQGPGYTSFSAPTSGPTWSPATSVTGGGAPGGAMEIFYRFFKTGDPLTYTFNSYTADYNSGFIVPVVGAQAATPITCASNYSNTNGTSATFATITPPLYSVDILSIVGNAGGTTFSAPTGFTLLQQINPPYHGAAIFKQQSPPNSPLSPVTTFSGSDVFAAAQCSVNPGPTPTPSPTPTPAVTYAPYSSLSGTTPPGGAYPYFPLSPYHATIPASPVPVPSATNYRWNQDQIAGSTPGDEIGDIQISEDASATSDDPTYYTDGDGTSIPLICALNSAGSVGKYYCDNTVSSFNKSIVQFWNPAGSCPDSEFGGANYGCPVAINFTIPAGAVTASDTDHHIVFIKTTETYNGVTGYEIDAWGDGSLSSATAPTSGDWTFAALGACDLASDGTQCNSSYATHIAGSMGLIRAEDILYCLTGGGSGNTSCTLPTAISVAPKCNGTLFTYPAAASDAQCGGGGTTGNTGTDSARLPEGSRGYLNETDSTINAMSIPDYQKVILRTMDKQHYGVFNRDTNYPGGPGLAPQYQGGEAYYSMGKTDPWRTLYNYEVAEGNSSYIVVSNAGLNLRFIISVDASAMNWCANSKNDGLCD